MELRAILLVALSLVFAPLCSSQQVNPKAYAPSIGKCPTNLTVRSASSGLSPQESAWRSSRFSQIFNSLNSYLTNANISGFDVATYLSKINGSSVPVAGLAISGGGSTSGMGGLGLWQAFDDRYEPAVKAGTGGFAQCLSYLTGLSGGGFNMVIPTAANNFSTLASLRQRVDLTSNYGEGPQGKTNAFFKFIFETTFFKFKEGFPVSVTDIFGQFFRQFLPASWAFKDYSDIADNGTAFSMGAAPMPIVLFAEVIPGVSPEIGKISYPGNSASDAIFEQTPFEFGNWVSGRVQAFFDTKYLGTSMNKGSPASTSKCTTGFDKVTFAQGTTANAFNFYFIDDFYSIPLFTKRDIPIPKKWENSAQVQLVGAVAQEFNQTFNASMWATYPNPFENYNAAMKGVKELLLVDGSESGETLPLRPLIVPERKVDFIVAYDASTDEPGNLWVNGSTFLQSSLHAKTLGLPFPSVPDPATMINLQLNKFPTFFGCNDSIDTPLVLYLPNAPWSAYTNYSFSTAEFTNSQLDLVFENSFNLATYGNGKYGSSSSSSATQPGEVTTHGSNVTYPAFAPPVNTTTASTTTSSSTPAFPACLACGMIYKSLLRTGQAVPAACSACFQAHCYNGTVDDSPADPSYEPTLILNPSLSFAQWNKTVWH